MDKNLDGIANQSKPMWYTSLNSKLKKAVENTRGSNSSNGLKSCGIATVDCIGTPSRHSKEMTFDVLKYQKVIAIPSNDHSAHIAIHLIIMFACSYCPLL